MSLHDPDKINELLAKFAGCSAVLHEYSEALSGILRLQITDDQDIPWMLTFNGCSYIQSSATWTIGQLTCQAHGSGLACEDAPGRFRVEFEHCHLITEEEYWEEGDHDD